MTLPELTEADYASHRRTWYNAPSDYLRAAADALHARLAERMAAEQPQPIDIERLQPGDEFEVIHRYVVTRADEWEPDDRHGPAIEYRILGRRTDQLTAYLRATLADHSALDLDATVAAIVAALNASDSPVSVEPRAVQS